MPTRRPPWEWHQNRDDSWDHFITDLLSTAGLGHEREYYGITEEGRAREVRRHLLRAGRHHKVAVKAFWSACTGCENGGADCRYHVHFSAYDKDVARDYMARKSQYAGGK